MTRVARRFRYSRRMSATAESPVLRTWTGPLESPPLGSVRVADFDAAFAAAFDRHLEEIAAIAAQSEPPTFQNTIAALEKSGRELARAMSLFQALTGTMADRELQAAEQRL